MERRLAAIMAADVVGYSRLMDEDEAGTLARFDGLKAEILDRLIAEHHGRVVKLMGDGFLIEFASVVDALECAIAWQEAVNARAQLVPDDQAMRFRIGVNLGDVIVKGDDVFGDGIIVAARLETMAEPGEILVSRTVADHVGGKISSGFEDLGLQALKNISEPVQVYRVVPTHDVPVLAAAANKKPRPGKLTVMMTGLVVFVLVIGGLAWQSPWEPHEELASVEKMAFPLPDKPSIAVLPLNNMSNDPNQEHFVDGMTEDLITDLSKVSGLFVIARNSTFVYKGAPVKIRRVAEDLGVRYVLEGSVRRVGDQLRVNAQLIDATTGGHIWADRFDGKSTDIFAVQDEFVLKIVNALAVELSDTEKTVITEHATDNLEARETFQKGWELYSRFNEKDNEKAFAYFEQAIALDPQFGRAHAALASAFTSSGNNGWFIQGSNVGKTYPQQFPRLLKKIEQFPSAQGHAVVAMDHVFQGSPGAARTEAAKAIALQPSAPEAHVAMAWALITDGKPADGLKFVEAALRLNPQYPAHYVLAHGIAYYGLGELEKSAQVFEQGRVQFPEATVLNAMAASILAQLGRRQEARAVVMAWKPGADQVQLKFASDSYNFPFRWRHEYQWVRERLLDGLRVAVLPLDVIVTSLIDDLKNATGFARASVVQTLGLFGPAAAPAVPNLIEDLGHEDRLFQETAVNALGKMGPAARDAIPALKAIEDEEFLGFYATAALKEIMRN